MIGASSPNSTAEIPRSSPESRRKRRCNSKAARGMSSTSVWTSVRLIAEDGRCLHVVLAVQLAARKSKTQIVKRNENRPIVRDLHRHDAARTAEARLCRASGTVADRVGTEDLDREVRTVEHREQHLGLSRLRSGIAESLLELGERVGPRWDRGALLLAGHDQTGGVGGRFLE